MGVAAFALVVLAAAAAAPSDLERNVAAYQSARDDLRREHAERWVAIAGGTVLAPFPSLEAAAAAADRAAPDARHRFLFRPGRDDADVEFKASPWTPEPGHAGNWNQIGLGWLVDHDVSFSNPDDTWTLERAGKIVSWPYRDVARCRLEIATPAGGAGLEAEFVNSGVLGPHLTVTEDLVLSLGLDRYGVPGLVRYRGLGDATEDFRRVRCRVRIPALDVDAESIAIVVKGPDREWAPRPHLEKVVRIVTADTTVDDRGAVDEIVKALLTSLEPIDGPPLAWDGARKVDFVSEGRSRVEIEIRGERLSMRLPGVEGSRDYALSPALAAALGKHGLR